MKRVDTAADLTLRALFEELNKRYPGHCQLGGDRGDLNVTVRFGYHLRFLIHIGSAFLSTEVNISCRVRRTGRVHMDGVLNFSLDDPDCFQKLYGMIEAL